MSPNDQVVWDWKSQDHIALEETGRFWRRSVNKPTPWGYDILHWNSIELAGDSVIASFRHLDAVYKIRKSTGNIVWKLGGTPTPRSLTVERDPRGNTFGAQHDARLLPDGTVTVFDNRTNLGQKRPRAVRFRIDEAGRNRDARAVDHRPRRPQLLLLRLGPALGQRRMADRLGKEESDRRLQAQRRADLPLDPRLRVELSARAGPRGRGLGGGPA